MKRRTLKSVALSSLFLLLLAGCGSSEDGPSLGEWTLETDDLRLSETLRVSETEDFYFGSITALDVTSAGRIVVADRQARNIKVLQPDRTLIDTLGGPGEGPGEFRRLTSVQIARGDSLFAYDHQLGRLTVFGPDAPYEESRSVTIERKGGIPLRTRALSNGYVTRFVIPPQPDPGVTRTEPRTWRYIDESGTPGDTVFTAPGPLVLATERGFGQIPLSSGVYYAWGPNGRLYHGWNDSLHVEARSIDGSSEVIASLPTEPAPVTEKDRDSLLNQIDNERWRNKMAPVLPDTKPAFTEMVVSDAGRTWVKRPGESPAAESVSWWILDPETKTIQQTQLPPDVELMVVRDGKAYGTTTTEMGAPALVRYTVNVNE
jgi:hypothetical protein